MLQRGRMDFTYETFALAQSFFGESCLTGGLLEGGIILGDV